MGTMRDYENFKDDLGDLMEKARGRVDGVDILVALTDAARDYAKSLGPYDDDRADSFVQAIANMPRLPELRLFASDMKALENAA